MAWESFQRTRVPLVELILAALSQCDGPIRKSSLLADVQKKRPTVTANSLGVTLTRMKHDGRVRNNNDGWWESAE